MNLPKKYKAKGLKTGIEFTGYYFQYPKTTYCFDTDPKPEILHGLVICEWGDWGMPNKIGYVEIDPGTLEELPNA